jgi:hypothetical protein
MEFVLHKAAWEIQQESREILMSWSGGVSELLGC